MCNDFTPGVLQSLETDFLDNLPFQYRTLPRRQHRGESKGEEKDLKSANYKTMANQLCYRVPSYAFQIFFAPYPDVHGRHTARFRQGQTHPGGD